MGSLDAQEVGAFVAIEKCAQPSGISTGLRCSACDAFGPSTQASACGITI
jgi:hypothetical protein